MLVLSRGEVESLLDLRRLVDALAVAMADLSAGRCSVPNRVAARVDEHDGMLLAMPAFLPSAGALTAKLVSLFPHNRKQPTHQAVICCFDPDTGAPLVLMDGTVVTAARTAAGSALATRLLAADTEVVAVVGTGEQARSHVRAMALLEGVRRIRIAGRDAAAAERLARDVPVEGVRVEAVASVEEAVRSAGVICATTHASRPIVRRSWLRPGAHVNSVGYNTAGQGEIDTATVREAFVVVESRAAALAPAPAGAPELRHALETGVIGEEHVAAEIGELVQRAARRVAAGQLTLYKSVGVAVQDAAAAALVLAAARERGLGARIEV